MFVSFLHWRRRANGETEAQLHKAARLIDGSLAAGNEALSLRLKVQGKGSTDDIFEVANGLWVDHALA